MLITRFLPSGATFDSQTTLSMNEAFESAWRVIQYAGLNIGQEVLASKIIAIAGRGERDAERIRDAAFRELGLHR
jgi:hypothetical protein